MKYFDLTPTAQRLVDAHALGSDEKFISGLVKGIASLGLIGNEAAVIAFAENFHATATDEPEQTSEDEQEPEKEPKTAEPEDAPESRAAERSRIQSIISAPEAEGREQSAQHLALNTDIDAAAAIELLRTIPLTRKSAEQAVPAFAAGTRACTADGGLVLYDAGTGTAAMTSSALGFEPYDPMVPINEKNTGKSAWKAAVAKINSESDV